MHHKKYCPTRLNALDKCQIQFQMKIISDDLGPLGLIVRDIFLYGSVGEIYR